MMLVEMTKIMKMYENHQVQNVYIVEDNIVKHFKGYVISRKTENSEVFVHHFHGATDV